MRFELKRSYWEDIQLFRYRSDFRWYLLLVFLLLVLPIFIGDFYVSQFNVVFIYSIVSVGMMLLTGYTGQLSLGHVGFFAIGSYTSAILVSKGIPFLLALPAAGFLAAFVGLFVALPAVRLSGMYLAIMTMGFAIIIEEILARWESLTRGNMGMVVEPPSIGSFSFDSEFSFYYLALFILILSLLAAKNILRSPTGRAMISIRDSEVASQAIGVNLMKYKAIAFALSAFFTGVAGSLSAHKLSFISPESFNFLESVKYLAMIIIGGLGSLHGAVLGTAFLLFLPGVIMVVKDFLPHAIANQTGLEPMLMGLVIVLFILFEPMGIYGRWFKVKHYFEFFPLYKKDTFKKVKSYYKAEKH
ncbi:MAG: branched-chain amino acid ABC transporter permease [Deltaproteobacteria bacterium]|jgi:branched-chain amino acid transport system permease protein|nr:branched-chain amino acid ABC transporter permease [Deltaproteobacteria bacterium]MBT4641139.1 branched-chain amino acid ABC transporter permease [Deltaproteobacteria bacterium]MBT6504979.1 branched-chain amino acid ABC transporter permease [Deltaproteobacteria bacterium]MBT6613999.1 branched-chain amino acid ABC transporter permease [Deltaproteobacteria bacterium]MBT7153962.1 branched-chain amino acid ABC transporter permease [Deltaproteobacteria bacterium]